MGGSSKKALKNAGNAATQALDFNKQTANLEADLNRYNETNPYGSVQWTKDPVTGQWSVNQSATPQLQGAINSSLDSQTAGNNAVTAGANRIAGTVGTAFDTSGLPGYANTPQADASLRNVPQSTVPTGGPVQTGLGNTGNPFAAVFGSGAVPEAMNVTPGQYQSALGDAGAVQSGIAPAGAVQRGIEGAGDVQRGIAGAGAVQRGIEGAGPINQNVGLQSSLGNAGPINSGASLTGSAVPGAEAYQRALDYSAAPSLYGSGNVSNDYNSAVSTAFGAQKANIDEAYATQRSQLEQRLADQGIPMDSEAARYQMAQLDKNRDAGYIQAQAAAANTGLNTQSTLSGLSLANRGQIVGETSNQGQFANQATDATNQNAMARSGQQFNQDIAGASFQNQSQQQQFNQMLQSGQFGNDAMLAAANYNLGAQGQQFGQNTAQASFANDAQAQAYGQNANDATFANQAQAQAYGQNANNATFANSAQAQQYGQNANDATFGNQAQAQRYGQALSSGEFANNATGRAFDNQLAASGQNYNQAANTQATRYGQQSDAQQQAYSQALGKGEFYNAGVGQKFGQDLTTQTTQFGQNMDRAGLYNQALQQDFGNNMSSAQQQNALRGQAFDERATARNIPISEVTSMMNAQQPTPQLPSVQTPGIQVAPVDFTGVYNSERQAQASKKNGITGAVGSMAGAAMGMCWVAREVYGADNPAWLEFRHWMLNAAPAWFRSLYIRHGERFAGYIADKPRLKAVIRFFMDKVR